MSEQLKALRVSIDAKNDPDSPLGQLAQQALAAGAGTGAADG